MPVSFTQSGLLTYGVFTTNEYGTELWVEYTAIVLPVSQLDLSGRLQNNNALLNWTTANEVNTSSFILERSTYSGNYTPVYAVSAYNTPGTHQYYFTDAGIDALHAAVVYYRVKQVDIDGHFIYSHIVALSPASKNIVLLYPNPATDKVSLLLTVNKAQQLQYRIIDNTGRILAEKKQNLVNGSNLLTIDVSNLAKGIYWIELKAEMMDERKPFVKN